MSEPEHIGNLMPEVFLNLCEYAEQAESEPTERGRSIIKTVGDCQSRYRRDCNRGRQGGHA